MKQRIKQLLPILIVMGITIVVSFMLYFKAMAHEEEKCWQLLSESAESVKNEFQMKFEDNLTFLRMTVNVIIEENRIEQISDMYLEIFEENTLFSRVDVIYPDNSMLTQKQTGRSVEDGVFEELAAKGEHISERVIDAQIGRECVYYYLPIIQEEEVLAILVGVIDTKSIAALFQPVFYNGEVNCCIVDSSDGNYILDTWHEKLENAYEIPDRKRLKEYEHLDLKEEIRNLRTGVIAFESKKNGDVNYMYYMPLQLFDWEILLFVQEKVAFESLLYLKELLIFAGIIEAVLLVIYFLWNFVKVSQLEKSKAETLEQLKISTTLIQCVTELSSGKDIQNSIQNLLQIINGYFKADRTYIFELNKEADIFVNTFEYVNSGVVSQIDCLQEVSLSALAGWMEHFQKSQAYYVSEMKKDAALSAMKKTENIDRLIAVPLCKNGVVSGFVGVDNPREFYDDATLLSSIQFFIINSLSSQKQQAQLKYLSYQDMLTSLYNRNKYIQVLGVYKNQAQQDIGAAYIDLNGLKKINDEQGHEAGDAAICNTASVISKIFPKEAYRIGGDEFVILCIGIEQEIFSEKLAKLEEQFEKEQINVSMGSLWQALCGDLEELLKEADCRMYEVKERYYQTHERRRK